MFWKKRNPGEEKPKSKFWDLKGFFKRTEKSKDQTEVAKLKKENSILKFKLGEFEKKFDAFIPMDWEFRKSELFLFCSLFSLLGFVAFWILSYGVKLLALGQTVELVFSGFFAFILCAIMIWIFLHKQVRRATADAFGFAKKLAQIIYHSKNRRVEHLDLKIPKGTRSIRIKGITNEKGELMEYSLNQNASIDNENNRTTFTMKDNVNHNIDDWIQSGVPEQNVEEDLIREKDLHYAEMKVRMEMMGQDKWKKAMMLMLVLNIFASLITVAMAFLQPK